MPIISKEEYLKAKAIVEQYEKTKREESRKKAIERIKSNSITYKEALLSFTEQEIENIMTNNTIQYAGNWNTKEVFIYKPDYDKYFKLKVQ